MLPGPPDLVKKEEQQPPPPFLFAERRATASPSQRAYVAEAGDASLLWRGGAEAAHLWRNSSVSHNPQPSAPQLHNHATTNLAHLQFSAVDHLASLGKLRAPVEVSFPTNYQPLPLQFASLGNLQWATPGAPLPELNISPLHQEGLNLSSATLFSEPDGSDAERPTTSTHVIEHKYIPRLPDVVGPLLGDHSGILPKDLQIQRVGIDNFHDIGSDAETENDQAFKFLDSAETAAIKASDSPLLTATLFVLLETSAGYALFERIQSEEIGQSLEDVQKATLDLAKFGRYVKMKSFVPFKSAAHALENLMDITEGTVNPHLKSFLEVNLPKSKKGNVELGVAEKGLAGSIKAEIGCSCVSAETNETVAEILRGLRLHSEKLLKQMKPGDMYRAQLGLGHSYSRAKVKFNVNRADNMIIQSINLLDQLDKDVNLFSMRVREWYSWHFPELIKIVGENAAYARCVKQIKDKGTLTEDDLPELETILKEDSIKAKMILQAAKTSMGTDISEVDMQNIEAFADRVISLTDYRKRLHEYLISKMNQVAPNLSALIGEIVGARLIAHAGSLTNLSKYPASTVQILGAEKALFRALKTRGNTPKYGLIYHSTFIGRAGAKNKGRISRILANKCSIASRIDCFLDKPTSRFGELLREQVEERLKFYEDSTTPRKNADVMSQAVKEVAAADDMETDEVEETTAKRKRKADPEVNGEDSAEKGAKKVKKEKEKKKKKAKPQEEEEEEQEVQVEPAAKPKKAKKAKEAEPEPVSDAPVKKAKKKKAEK
ncbi:snoRNP complex protein nop56 [Phlyctochytrium bullatum]|nr:snoRNP complex protein nop56 [Phlyctochytrium bullatum]